MNVIKRILCYPAILANVIVGGGLLFSAYSPFISPVMHPYWACTGLFFPLFLLANFGFLVYWLFLHRYLALLPLFFYALSWNSIRTYIPFNREHKALDTEKILDILTYNVMYLNQLYEPKQKGLSAILSYIRERNADIVCLQEFPMKDKESIRWLSMYPYYVMEKSLACFSKYPILSFKLIPYKSVYNGSMLLKIKVNSDTLLVINNHLESNKMDRSDKLAYKAMLTAPNNEKVKKDGKHLLKKLADAVSLRAPQADSVAQAIVNNQENLILVCGDFNDSPISYAHRVIGRGLNDAFVEAGNGPGFTYNRSRMYFRIDHVFVSSTFRVLACQVDRQIKASDHYPVWTRLAIRPTFNKQ